MKATTRTLGISIALLMAAGASTPMEGAVVTKAEHITVKGRILARVPLERLSTIGLNYESYLVEVKSGSKKRLPAVLKLSYRFHHRESRFPATFFNYDLVQTIRITRDNSCDERWEDFSTRYLFEPTGAYVGKRPALEYAPGASSQEFQSESMLSCYTFRPKDHKRVSRLSASADTPATESQTQIHSH